MYNSKLCENVKAHKNEPFKREPEDLLTCKTCGAKVKSLYVKSWVGDVTVYACLKCCR